MARIQMVPEDQADGVLKEAYDKVGYSPVANILKIQSLNPQALIDHLNLYRTIMFGKSKLPRKQREMIAVVVSSVNACHY